MIVMDHGVVDFPARTADFTHFAVIVEAGSEFYDLEVELLELLGRIWARVKPELIVKMP